MYHAKIHTEQRSDTLSDGQLKQLHKSIHYICGTAVELLGDEEKFPETWLFNYRWGKGKKDAPKALPNGEKIVFLTVGGRTSAVIPSVQKKTGPLAKEMSEAESAGEEDASKKKAKQKRSEVDNDGGGAGGQNRTDVVVKASTKKPTPKKSRQSKFKKGMNDEEEVVDASATTKGRKRKADINGEAQSTPAKKGAHSKDG
jgi:formamidopyrimidine-DNA glycosylase